MNTKQLQIKFAIDSKLNTFVEADTNLGDMKISLGNLSKFLD